MGRFINADVFASTGQGLLGTNMFVYCLNNPANNCDPSGYCTFVAGGLKNDITNSYLCPCCGSGSGGGALLVSIADVADTIAESILFATSYVYKQYTKSIKASAFDMQPGNYPVTHHIVPYGQFSARKPEVKDQLARAQEIMIAAGVFPMTDPFNQLVLSATYHVTLHTDPYILMVTTPIIALGNGATKEQIYEVLWDLRIIVASGDQYGWGY